MLVALVRALGLLRFLPLISMLTKYHSNQTNAKYTTVSRITSIQVTD